MRPEQTDLIDLALAEDIGTGDVTTQYFTAPERRVTGRIFAKEPCVIAGLDEAEEVFRRVDVETQVRRVASDGSRLAPGETALELSGRAASLLTAERVALNFLQRLSGVATLTRKYVDTVAGTNAKVLDTRKTTPGWRLLEKKAVAAGGGTNHRIGLYDMVMVKDNHLAASRSLDELKAGIERLKADKPDLRVEVEADTLEQVRAFLSLSGVDVILLDNMSLEQMREAVGMRRAGVAFEASGGVTLERMGEIARTGVDFISVGALTHSCRSVDLSLEITDEAA